MLLLIDLDNTLIDRTAAFKAWAAARFGPSEVPWLVTADRDGYEPRERLALLIAQRYALKAADVLTELRAGLAGSARLSTDRDRRGLPGRGAHQIGMDPPRNFQRDVPR